jgi:hypothetical protein
VAGGSVIDPQVVDALVTRRARLRESPLARLTQSLSLSESSVEKHVNAIFTKLGLTGEQQVHRRVAAVLTFLRDASLHPPG